MSQIVFLTGASGFLAKRIAVELLNAGHAVRGSLRNLSRGDEVRAAVAPALTEASAAERLSFVALDLEQDAGWDSAMTGCTALIHTASPFPIASPKDPAAVIRPAVEGTRRALGAAARAGIGRVVLTSSTQAVLGVPDAARHAPYTEADWTDTDDPRCSTYNRSKTLAERAAWDIAAREGLALTAINPGWILGRPLDRHFGSSIALVARLLSGRDPMAPDMGFVIADLRDVALAHLRALERPGTAGKRFIVSDEAPVSLPEWGRMLKSAHPGRRIATRTAPRTLLRLLALFDGDLRESLRYVGVHPRVSAAAARDVLGLTITPARDSLLAAAAFLVEQKLA